MSSTPSAFEFAVPAALQVHNLHFAYPSFVSGSAPVEVLKGVTFEIQPGEFVALLGRIGAGKSTLCLALNGLVPHATGGVFRGKVRVGELDTRRHTVPDLARGVGLVFQDPETQLTQMRVEDEVAFGPENLGASPLEIGERLEWALGAVGLTQFRDRSPGYLSGGEKQRVTIAATLAMRPQVLVLDEPTSNLDPRGKAAVFGVLARLARTARIAILIATQDVERVTRYADRALVLHEGRIVADGAPDRLFASAHDTQQWGVGGPQMAELAAALRERTGHPLAFTRAGPAFAALRRDAPPLLLPTHSEPRTAPPVEPLARFEHVSFAYPDGTPALADISLELACGEFVALVGPNGSGKTTLAKHLNGLLKPTRGRVTLTGLDTRTTSVPQLARVAGYVFQNPDHQIFAPTVWEEIAFSLRLQGLSSVDVAARTAETLAEHGLSEFGTLPPALLGSGKRRQVALAAVLATRPRVLILDEPTGGLDRTSRQEMLARVTEFRRHGGTVVLITHDMGLVAEYAARAVVLAQGRILFDSAPGALFARRDLLRRAGLVVPPVVRLAQRLWGDEASLAVRTPQELADALAV